MTQPPTEPPSPMLSFQPPTYLEKPQLPPIAPEPAFHISTGTFTSPTKIPIPTGFTESECKFLYFSHSNYYGGWTKDIVATYGVGRQATLPYGNGGGWKGGAWMCIATRNMEGSIAVLTGTYDNPMELPIPEGFDESECTFFWGSQGNYYGGSTGDVVFECGGSRRASVPYQGNCGWKGGAYMVLGIKPTAPIRAFTSTYQVDTPIPVPEGYPTQSQFFMWGSCENYYGANTGDVVPMFGNGPVARLPYSGQKYWKSGAYLCVLIK
eukprot:PhF_6_TR9105/c0_g1_i3/m.14177